MLTSRQVYRDSCRLAATPGRQRQANCGRDDCAKSSRRFHRHGADALLHAHHQTFAKTITSPESGRTLSRTTESESTSGGLAESVTRRPCAVRCGLGLASPPCGVDVLLFRQAVDIDLSAGRQPPASSVYSCQRSRPVLVLARTGFEWPLPRMEWVCSRANQSP